MAIGPLSERIQKRNHFDQLASVAAGWRNLNIFTASGQVPPAATSQGSKIDSSLDLSAGIINYKPSSPLALCGSNQNHFRPTQLGPDSALARQ